MPEADAFFKYLLTLSLSENNRLYKLIVVDRTPTTPKFGRAEDQKPGEKGKSLEQKYRDLLEPLFQERRFSIHLGGLEMFLQGGAGAYDQLGRGDGLGGNISLY